MQRGNIGAAVLGRQQCRAFVVGCVLLLALVACVAPARAQQGPKIVDCPALGQDLLAVPEIKSQNGRLRGILTLTDGLRTLWGSKNITSIPPAQQGPEDNRCATQYLRFFTGVDVLHPQPWPSTTEPLPGPTLRARVGDLIEITFLNQVDTQHFTLSLDQAEQGKTSGCDEVYHSGKQLYPGQVGDSMPNCLHGSSTANVHFHGTHTTPSTTGDNVLLYIRPALRRGGKIEPTNALVQKTFAQIFQACEKNGPPTKWQQLPQAWRSNQKALLRQYDRTAAYQGQPGKLPPSMRLWPVNAQAIAKGLWPQYQLGAYPYCFSLPAYDPAKVQIGQAPGTHWYHAHKHGSTALNIANGMTGAFVVEGQYDDDLRKYYGQALREQVLVIQQLSAVPFPLTNARATPQPGAARPPLSVNGRRNPVIKMRPGEVQLWRIVNGAFREAVLVQNFTPEGSSTPCSNSSTPCVAWRQIAQDGVQFDWTNYARFGTVDAQFNMAAANRVDLLVRAPSQTGQYNLNALANITLLGTDDKNATQVTLLTVSVEGQPISPPMNFIENQADFPTFPVFLKDIPESKIYHQRKLVFKGGPPFTINGDSFSNHTVNQTMQLNSPEEWTVMNEDTDKSHPFHIHINPFQIVEVFSPSQENTTDPTKPCYVNPDDPETWKPCNKLTGPFVWWDTFAISTAFQVTGPSGKQVTIPGYFKMRSRFADFTGQFVLHCHILIHEDRGMMELIEVVPTQTQLHHD
jgi:FtsP/CotA-like multicopper oxidase with cupredoxin domain